MCYFETARAKTDRDVIATISPETQGLLQRYLDGLGFVVPPDQPFIRNRSGHSTARTRSATTSGRCAQPCSQATRAE